MSAFDGESIVGFPIEQIVLLLIEVIVSVSDLFVLQSVYLIIAFPSVFNCFTLILYSSHSPERHCYYYLKMDLLLDHYMDSLGTNKFVLLFYKNLRFLKYL